MSLPTIDLRLDVDSCDVERELASLAKELADASLEIREFFVGRFLSIVDAGCIDIESLPTSAAGVTFVRLKFSDSFNHLVTAFRAGDLMLDGIEADVHGRSFREKN